MSEEVVQPQVNPLDRYTLAALESTLESAQTHYNLIASSNSTPVEVITREADRIADLQRRIKEKRATEQEPDEQED